MSSRARKKTKEPEAKAAKVHVILQKPAGAVPTAEVMSRHEGEMVSRGSRGFSEGELASSGVVLRLAKAWGLPMDIRRRSVLDNNVEALKAWYSKAKQVERPSEARKIEKEVKEVVKEAEKEVKRGAARAKKEAVKAEKEIKKVEEEVVEKVEKPAKARRGAKKAPKASEKKARSKKEKS